MRNKRRHENGLEASLAGISQAVMRCARMLDEQVPDEGEIRMAFDDSIVTDTAAEKAQDMVEVGVTMAAWEYRV